ncbi:MAG: DUF7338 family protein, partial [Burkholderiaceae bacterium]
MKRITVSRWLGINLLLIAASIAQIPLAPIAVLFANRETGRLPFWAHWMETPDDTLPGGTYEPVVRALYE